MENLSDLLEWLLEMRDVNEMARNTSTDPTDYFWHDGRADAFEMVREQVEKVMR